MNACLKVFSNHAVWIILILLAYFSSDIIAKGHTLNELTPYPCLGYAMWAGVLFVVWWLFLMPIWQFCKMLRPVKTNLKDRAKEALKFLKKHGNMNDGDTKKLYGEINNLLNKRAGYDEALRDRERLHALIARCYEENDMGKKARDVTLKYAKGAGIGTVISRNPMLDGLIMLIVQMKMIVELSKLYGYKPSAVFNLLCFCWVISNSVITALLAQDLAEDAGDFIAESIKDGLSNPEEATGGAVASMFEWGLGKVMSGTAKMLTEALAAGSLVYVTGRIFICRLEHHDGKTTAKDLLKWRREGRRKLIAGGFSAAWKKINLFSKDESASVAEQANS